MLCVLCVCCVVMCGENIQNTQETLRNMSKHGLRFGHDMVNHGPPRRSENGHFPRRIVFFFLKKKQKLPWVLPTLPAEGPNPNVQKGTCLPQVPLQRSKSCVGKGPNQRNTRYFHPTLHWFVSLDAVGISEIYPIWICVVLFSMCS